MRPMRKDVLDKAAWAWVQNTLPLEVTDDHVQTAYRIGLTQCLPGNCRRNCRGNPRCISALGQQRWLSEVTPNHTTTEDDFTSRYKDPKTFVGLKNLGATCYVNSLLQLWFHNLPFRKAMYEWRPEDDPEEQLSLITDPPSFPTTTLGHLQLLFARLQFGNQRFIDPSDFIHSLGLDTNQQQDAQEFSKLFISMLEDKLTHQTSAVVRNLISQNFRGQYSYVTRCMKCGTESCQLSTFYELDLNIQGHKTLGDSLSEFLHEESLDGANRYFCTVCNEKQDAKRSIKLNSLPPMLHLQLLRFVYDRTKGHKKKLNSFIQFPEKLDMSEYLGIAPNTVVYHLSAVLVHMGSSAYSGHYVAHIRDSTSGMWNKFNDEIVERMEGKNLKLGAEDDSGDFVVTAKKPRIQRPAKGFLTSKNAYMLVYSVVNESNPAPGETAPAKVSTQVPNNGNSASGNGGDVVNGGKTCEITEDALKKEMTQWKLHDLLQSLVLKYNKEFDAYIDEQQKVKDASEAHDLVQREEMRHLCLSLSAGTSDQFDFVPLDWLTKCLQEGVWEATKLGPSITRDLCPHNKLDPTKVTSTKCISSVIADQLYESAGCGLRLQAPDALCKECVVRKCLEMRLKSKLASDSKEVTNLLKQRLDESEAAFWVGKRTLKSWRSLALNCVIYSPSELKSHRNGTTSPAKKQEPNESSPADSKATRNGRTSPEKKQEAVESNAEPPSPTKTKPTRNGSDSPPKKLDSNEASPGKRLPSDECNGAEEFTRVAKKLKTEPSPEQEHVVSSTDDSLVQVIRKRMLEAVIASESDTESDQDPQTSDSSENGNGKQSQGTENAAEMTESEAGDKEAVKEEAEDKSKETKTEDEDDDEDLIFNEDIVCPHGELIVDESKRRLVSSMVWNVFSSYFPHVKVFHKDVPVCSECQSTALAGEAAKEMHRKAALAQKEALADLFYDRNRPRLSKEEGCVLFINNVFLADWRRFIRDCGRCAPPDMIINSSLLCEHAGLLYHPLEDPEAPSRMTAARIQEWSALVQYYAADVEIRVSRNDEDDRVELHPEACSVCMEMLQAERIRRDLEARSHFDRAKIWVRRVDSPQSAVLTDATAAAVASSASSVPVASSASAASSAPAVSPAPAASSAPSTGAASSAPVASSTSAASSAPSTSAASSEPAAPPASSAPVAPADSPPPPADPGDPEFMPHGVATSAGAPAAGPAGPGAAPAAAPPTSTLAGVVGVPLVASSTETSENPDIRRSARSRRPRGDKELIVSSDNTLMDLKLMIFKHFQVAPFDQHLTLNGRSLDDSKATLGDLNVYPDALLLLRVCDQADEPSTEEFIKSSRPEEGFKGTGLLGR